MIASLTGVVINKDQHSAVIAVSGIGFRVFASASTLSKLRIDDQATLKTSLVVREDALTLYGFVADEELLTFDLLCSVSGVGPKSALAILSQLSVAEISRAVSSEDDQAFRSVSGIGSKTAKLIILSLAGKLSSDNVEDPKSKALIALVGLGWGDKAAREAVAEVSNPELNEQQILRAALQRLAPKSDKA